MEALSCLDDSSSFQGFIDDDPVKQTTIGAHKVYNREKLKEPGTLVLAVPGNPENFRKRKEIITGLNIPHERFTTVIHPKAVIAKGCIYGTNLLVMAGVVVTANAHLGDHIILLPNTVIHHDTVISDYVISGSNVTIAGHCRVGEGAYIGSGSTIINNITIGKNCMIGAGSVVLHDTEDDSVYAGNPAKRIR